MTGPQTKQARPSVKAARINEPERAWLGSSRLIGLALAGTCAIQGTAGRGMETTTALHGRFQPCARVPVSYPPAGHCRASVARHRHVHSK